MLVTFTPGVPAAVDSLARPRHALPRAHLRELAMMKLLRPPLGPDDHIRGELTRPLQLVEFGDYECPLCGQAYLVIGALERALGDRLCVGFRNFPLTAAHPYAQIAAEAAEAAGAQGKFWLMHDLLMTHQDALDVPHLGEYAQKLGLDMFRFVDDLQAHRFADKIRADRRSGALSGVSATPTFFVQGRKHTGPWDFDSLYAALTGEPLARTGC
ncbi:MAG TPA: thioredoxin domain-containing protein [Nannocystis sp.]